MAKAASTYIVSNWSAEVKKVEVANAHAEAYRLEKLEEFKTSKCDLFDLADFQYYAEVTGLSLAELKAMAQYDDDDQKYINSFIIDEDFF